MILLKKPSKTDVFILIIPLAISLILAIWLYLPRNHANIAQVYVDGELYQTLLFEDKAYDVDIMTRYGKNTLRLKDNTIDITYADCPSQTCVNTAPQSQNGGIIACLPHNMYVVLRAKSEDGVDIVAK